MKHDRLHALADGIFAIVMTLLVLDLKLPDLAATATGPELRAALFTLWPVFFSFTLSFAVLYGYWRAHNFIVSTYTKNLDIKLINLNMVFLFFVSLVPFSTNLLGRFIGNPVGIIVYGLNLGALGLALWSARTYADKSEHIETAGDWTRRDRRNGAIRSFLPVVTAMLAAIVSLRSGVAAILLLVVSVVSNMTSKGLDGLFAVLDNLGIGID